MSDQRPIDVPKASETGVTRAPHNGNEASIAQGSQSLGNERSSSGEPVASEGSESLPARRATGPRTPEGKQRSKHNALKHGIFSKIVLLKDESRLEFNSLLNGLRNDLRPEGTLEEILVDKLASLLWRYRRILIAERSKIRRGTTPHSWYKSDRDEQEAAEFIRSEGKVRVGWFSKIENPFMQERCIELLQKWQAIIEIRGFDSSVDAHFLTVLFGDAEVKAPTVELVLIYMLCTRSGKYPDPEELDKLEGEQKELIESLATPEGRKAKFLQSLQHQIDGLQGLPKSLDRIAGPRDRLESLCRRVPDAPELDHLLRYEVSFDRSFDGTLSQLERLQRMRAGQPVPPELKVRLSG